MPGLCCAVILDSQVGESHPPGGVGERVRILDDVSVVGFDEMPGISPERGLTVARQPLAELGRACVERILEQRRTGRPFRVAFQPDIVERSSVRKVD